MKHKIKVIFVCTGNICRSPTAEAIFNKQLKTQNIEDNFIVKSAGTHAMVGYSADERSKNTAAEHGISLNNMVAKQFTKKDALEFDYIIALDENNYNFLLQNVSDSGKIYQLASFVKSEKLKNIPDPYYNDNFEYVFFKIEEGVENLIKHILKV